MMEDLKMNRQSQWLFEAPFVFEAENENAKFSISGLPTSSRKNGFSVTSNTASYIHQNSPSDKTFSKRSCQFLISTYSCDSYCSDMLIGEYWFQVEFQYNGNDLRMVSITPLFGKSKFNQGPLFQSDEFTIIFTPKPKSAAAEPVAEIIYDFSGTWNHKYRGIISNFKGTITVSANGKVWRTFSFQDNRVRHVQFNC
jgi:hypothetical protein